MFARSVPDVIPAEVGIQRLDPGFSRLRTGSRHRRWCRGGRMVEYQYELGE